MLVWLGSSQPAQLLSRLFLSHIASWRAYVFYLVPHAADAFRYLAISLNGFSLTLPLFAANQLPSSWVSHFWKATSLGRRSWMFLADCSPNLCG